MHIFAHSFLYLKNPPKPFQLDSHSVIRVFCRLNMYQRSIFNQWCKQNVHLIVASNWVVVFWYLMHSKYTHTYTHHRSHSWIVYEALCKVNCYVMIRNMKRFSVTNSHKILGIPAVDKVYFCKLIRKSDKTGLM